MARRKKKRLSPDEAALPDDDMAYKKKVPAKLNNPFAAALAGVSAPKKKAAPAPKVAPKKKKAPKGFVKRLPYEDRVVREQAYAGVTRLDGKTSQKKSRVPAPESSSPLQTLHDHAEQDARARLGALVGAAVPIVVKRESDSVSGARKGTHPSILESLSEARPKAILDLHGMTSSEADQALCRFVRSEHKHGQKFVLIIHGKGSHSEGGIGVLGDLCVRVLSRGGAAPLVEAFGTSHRSIGGQGAMVVRLKPSKKMSGR